MADRPLFLEKIRQATARGRAHRVAINPNATHTAAYVGGGDDPIATMLDEWQKVGGRGKRVAGIASAHAFVRDFVEESQVRKALCWKHPLLERLEIHRILGECGIAELTWDECERQSAKARWPAVFAADLGITSVDWAVAETGSLALCARPGQGRSASLLPPRYLAIIEPAQIVPDLFDLFERLEPEKDRLPSNVTLVTGPSKTGDIELKLTTGVHGPGDVCLLVVES